MRDMTAFEQRLGERLVRELDRESVAFDADRIAAVAMVRRRPFDRVLNRLALDPLPMATARKAALVAVAALLAVATIALVVGVVRPGGSRLAFIRQNGDVVLANGDGSGESVIYRVEGPVLFTQLALAPGGEHLAVVDESFQLVIMDRTGEVTFSTEMEAGFNRFAWSPDGRRLAIFDGPWLPVEPAGSAPQINPSLDIVGTDGAVEWAAPLPPDFRYEMMSGELAWSPDSRSIVITGSVEPRQFITPLLSSLWIVDVDERTVHELGGSPAEFAPGDHLPAWLPDGSLVFSRQRSGIWQVDPRTGAGTRILAIPPVCAPDCSVNLIEPSPDGSRLLIDHPTQRLSILERATGISTPLPTPVAGLYRTLTWTADGKSLLVAYPATPREMPFVAAIDLASGERHTLVEGAQVYDYVP